MIRTFKSKALAELWTSGTTRRIDARLHGRLLRRLDRLNVVAIPQEMNLPGFDFHALKGHKPPRYTVHVNGPWYITFAYANGDAEDVVFEQYH